MGALHVPQRELMARIGDVAPPESKVVVYCAHGNRSLFAAAALRQAGYEAVSLAGGLAAWMQAGQPVARSGSAASTRMSSRSATRSD